jgi:hypothetical protein
VDTRVEVGDLAWLYHVKALQLRDSAGLCSHALANITGFALESATQADSKPSHPGVGAPQPVNMGLFKVLVSLYQERG